MENIVQKIDETVSYIKGRIDFVPEIAIILGSGLGALSGIVEEPVCMSYNDIPNFRASTVKGHAGQLIAGTIEGRKVLVMSGRFHYYEGHSMDTVTLPIRVFARLGIKDLIVTNAAGGIGDSQTPGSIMLIKDHISFMCPSPLIGPNLDEWGTRFPDMSEVYSKELIGLAKEVADSRGIPVTEGVYCYFRGPQYETPAEIRAAALWGATAAGMSTVPEAIVATHSGMRILGISLITNKAAGLQTTPLSHKEVGEVAALSEKNMLSLVTGIISEWK